MIHSSPSSSFVDLTSAQTADTSQSQFRSSTGTLNTDVEKHGHSKSASSTTLPIRDSPIPNKELPEIQESDDLLIVNWSGSDDPENPRNWNNVRRWTVTVVVSFFTFISPVASSISSPSLPNISRDLHIPPDSVLENMTLSIFVLAYALGVGLGAVIEPILNLFQPLFWGPLSELFGRLLILQVSNIWFLIFNTLCGFAKSPIQLLIFRFLAGFGGAAPQSVGGGVIGDLWSPVERGMAMSLYSIAPLVGKSSISLFDNGLSYVILGPSTGPLVGGWIAQKSHWQWVFWSVSIADAVLQIAGFVFLRETYGPELLRRKARKLRKQTGKQNVRSIFEDKRCHWTTVMGRGMVKPLIFLATEPIVQVFALYMAVLYGVLYLSLTTFVKVFIDGYRQSTGIAGVHYLSIALGSTVGGQIGARALNKIYLVLKAKNRGIGTPEMRLPLLMVTATTLPIGLLLYGWSSNFHLFWLVPDLGVFIYSIGIGGNWTCIQTYLVDCYALHAASAIAGVSSFRAFAGFGFPLFADKMYGRLGYGWGNSILALICLVIGCPAPFIFYRYGARLRAWSKGSSVEQEQRPAS